MGKSHKKSRDFYHRHKPMKHRRYSLRAFRVSLYEDFPELVLGYPERFFDSVKEAESVAKYLARQSSWADHVIYDEFEKRVVTYVYAHRAKLKSRYDHWSFTY